MLSNYSKIKQVEDWLRDYRSLKDLVENLEEQIYFVGEDGMGVDTSREVISKTNKFSSIVENAMLHARKLEDELEEYKLLLDKINNALAKLEPIEQSVITFRLIEGKYYHQVVKVVGKSESSCRAIKKIAIEKMVKELEESKVDGFCP